MREFFGLSSSTYSVNNPLRIDTEARIRNLYFTGWYIERVKSLDDALTEKHAKLTDELNREHKLMLGAVMVMLAKFKRDMENLCNTHLEQHKTLSNTLLERHQVFGQEQLSRSVITQMETAQQSALASYQGLLNNMLFLSSLHALSHEEALSRTVREKKLLFKIQKTKQSFFEERDRIADHEFDLIEDEEISNEQAKLSYP